VAGLTQLALEVNSQVTICPFDKFEVVKVGLLLPAFTPFTFHWNDGDPPPLLMVAVKVTFEFKQLGLLLEVMLILGSSVGNISKIIGVEITKEGTAQLREELISQVSV
jgi:hypothetical protein